MTPEEMINSDDIEVAELGCNLFLKEKNTTVHDLNKILKEFKKYYVLSVTNHQVLLMHRFNFTINSGIFIKDPTRTILMDIK